MDVQTRCHSTVNRKEGQGTVQRAAMHGSNACSPEFAPWHSTPAVSRCSLNLLACTARARAATTGPGAPCLPTNTENDRPRSVQQTKYENTIDERHQPQTVTDRMIYIPQSVQNRHRHRKSPSRAGKVPRYRRGTANGMRLLLRTTGIVMSRLW